MVKVIKNNLAHNHFLAVGYLPPLITLTVDVPYFLTYHCGYEMYMFRGIVLNRYIVVVLNENTNSVVSTEVYIIGVGWRRYLIAPYVVDLRKQECVIVLTELNEAVSLVTPALDLACCRCCMRVCET